MPRRNSHSDRLFRIVWGGWGQCMVKKGGARFWSEPGTVRCDAI